MQCSSVPWPFITQIGCDLAASSISHMYINWYPPDISSDNLICNCFDTQLTQQQPQNKSNVHQTVLPRSYGCPSSFLPAQTTSGSPCFFPRNIDEHGGSGASRENQAAAQFCLCSVLESWSPASENRPRCCFLRRTVRKPEAGGFLLLQCDRVCQREWRLHRWHCEASNERRRYGEAFHC